MLTLNMPYEVPVWAPNIVQISAGSEHIIALIATGFPVAAPRSAIRKSGNTVTLSVPTRFQRVYRLESSDSPAGPFQTFSPLSAGTGRTLSFSETTSSPQRFYRVSEW